VPQQAPPGGPGENRKEDITDGTLTVLDRAIAHGGQVVSYLFLLSGAIIVYEIIARYVFNAPTTWGHETTLFLCGLCFAYGGSYCLARDKHIRIMIVYGRVSAPVRLVLDIILSLVGVVFGGTLAYGAYLVAEKAWFAPWGEFRLETSGSAWNPPFPALVKGMLLLVLVVMTIQYILHVIHFIRARRDV
jgi:TRAP-type C4-dicarboxylate transport system permease small subunit